ncbi:MAG: DUF4838 domain-containing protein, partial [Clostridia bacterium]|nr:DUF4838 domain-containing protein [Clostridia bacterium]
MENYILISNKQTEYTVVYPFCGDRRTAERNAAEYISQYAYKSTGVKIPVCADNDAIVKTRKFISVGRTALQQQNGIRFNYGLLAHDGYFIKTAGDCVYIDGVSGRGIFYGALEFIERVMGVKFLAFDDIFVPKTDTIRFAETDITDNPDFEDRTFSHEKTMNDYKFMAEMRMIDEYVDFPEEYGGNLGWFWDKRYLISPVHNTLSFVEPDKYYEKHPEWFFSEKGYPIDLCYSHTGLKEDGSIDESLAESPVKIAAAKMTDIIINDDKNCKYYMIGQMDYPTACTCPDCIEQEQKYGRSGMLIRFVNAVAREVRKNLNERGIKKQYHICTFAYQWSQSAPAKRENGKIVPMHDSVVPDDDVLIRICSIKANQYYSVISPKQIDITRNMFEEWAVLLEGKTSMIWSYHSRFTYPFCFFPTMQHWKQDFEVYRRMGCKYIFMEPNHFEPNDWKTVMETYVAAKLLWDNGKNPYSLRDEFIKYYYGPISDLVKRFTENFDNLFTALMEKTPCPDMRLQGLDDILSAKWYSIEFWEEQFRLIDEMYAIIAKARLSDEEK